LVIQVLKETQDKEVILDSLDKQVSRAIKVTQDSLDQTETLVYREPPVQPAFLELPEILASKEVLVYQVC